MNTFVTLYKMPLTFLKLLKGRRKKSRAKQREETKPFRQTTYGLMIRNPSISSMFGILF